MSGYLNDVFDLVNKIRKDGADGTIYKYREDFYAIERKLSHLFDKKEDKVTKVIKERIEEIQKAIQGTDEGRAFAAYLLMIDRLKREAGPFVKVGIICVMIPVICAFLRRFENENK